jgi:hypothetical protein
MAIHPQVRVLVPIRPALTRPPDQLEDIADEAGVRKHL